MYKNIVKEDEEHVVLLINNRSHSNSNDQREE